MKTLAVGTWNIAAGRKLRSRERFDYIPREDAAYIAERLRAAKLDVVCIQESHVSQNDSLAERLGELAAMPYVVETPGCPSHIDPAYKINNAILSKRPLDATAYTKLPHPNFDLVSTTGKVMPPYDRYVQTAHIGGITIANMHTEPLEMFNTSYAHGPGLAFAAQIDRVLTERLVRPLLFAADFNMEHLEPLPSLLQTKQLSEALPAEAPTKPHGGHPDHILYSPEFELQDAGIMQTETDHFLCWAKVQYTE